MPPRILRPLTLAVGALVFAATANAAPITCQAHSPAHRVALLELYTSEGCSSCPPADRWLAGLQAHGFHTDRVVPLALHVDYWNYLGWEDPFAQPAFTQRQYRYGRQLKLSTVYTPQLILGGRNFVTWHRGGLGKELVPINKETARATLRARLEPDTTGKLRISAHAQLDGAGSDNAAGLYVAIYERKITRDIGAGENSGKRLRHDYVARVLLGPAHPNDDLLMGIEGMIDVGKDWKPADLGLVAFVQSLVSGEVLQALDLPTCK